MSRQLVVHRPSTVTNAWRRRNLSLCACIAFVVCSAYPVSGQDQRLATFYGAYQRIKPSSSDSGLNVALDFKTSSSPNGLLLAVRLDDRDGSNAGYLGIGFVDRHLVVVLSGNTDSVNNTTTEFALQRGVWYALSLHIVDTNIAVSLTNGSDFSFSSSLAHSSPLSVRDVFLGGANSFFSRAFTTLEITEYFVGCLANFTVNQRDIDFAPKLEGYGMQYGCCQNPEPIAWNFVPGQQNTLVFKSRLSHSRFQTNKLVFSYVIEPEHDGMIVYSHDEDIDFALAIELLNGSILIHMSNEVDILNAYFLACGGTIVNGWRHEVEISIRQDHLECVVDGRRTHLNVTVTRFPTDTLEYHIGSANVSTSSTTLHIFQLHPRTIATDGMFPSFGGSLQKFQLNGLEVSPSVLPPNPPLLSPACPQMVDLPPTCQEFQEFSLAQLAQVSVVPSAIRLDENGTVLLRDSDLSLYVPESMDRPGTQEVVRSSMRFSVDSYPIHGVLVNTSSPDQQIVQFSYSHLRSSSVAYHHNGEEESADSISLEVTSICSPVIKMSVTVLFSIRLTNDPPVVRQLGTLAIAVGTRRVISPNVISVEDEESPSLTSVWFRVKSILVDMCGTCSPAGRVERTTSPGLNSTHFNQMEINNGNLWFQHFRQFGTEPITISLSVSDSVGVSVGIEIPVVPYIGNVTLVRNEPLYIVEGRCAYITADHLRADTNFNDQNPILQYSIISAPGHGRLDVLDQGHWRPALEGNVVFEGFTQQDVNLNRVRYCHSNNSRETDSFPFQLHSTLLPGGSGTFTIHVSAYADLPKPNISLTTTPVSLVEGGQVLFSENTLAVSLVQSVSPPWLQEMVQIDSFGIFFHLEQALPSFGKISINGENLTGTGFSLAQLAQGMVEYRHDNSENHRDLLQLSVEALNAENLPIQYPNLPPLTNLSVIITPVNDHNPVVVTSNITVAEGGFVTLTPRVLNIVDEDRPPENISVSVLNQDLEHGFFALSDTATPITQFTATQIQEGTVYFHHMLNASLPPTHTVTILLSDGTRSSRKEIEINAQSLEIDTSGVPVEACIAELDAISDSLTTQVMQGPFLSVEIRDEHGTDTNRLQNMVLRVAQQPVHGDLLLSGTSLSVFTLNDLDNQLVTYRFRNRTNNVYTDSVTIEVRYGHSRPAFVRLNICINPVPAPNLSDVLLRPINLTNSSPRVLIDNSTFQAVDTRGEGGEAIVYSITHPPRWGKVVDENDTILTHFTQADVDQSMVSYFHANQSSSTLRDYFIIQLCTAYVCDGKFNITVTFSVTSLTVFNRPLNVTENGMVTIGRNNLDAIAPVGGVTFHVRRPPTKGKLVLNNGGIEYDDPDFFDVQHIASGSVFYQHDGSESIKDNFAFTVTTSHSDERVSDTFRITIIPVNDNPPLLLRKEFSMIARTTRNITTEDLRAYDDDSDIRSELLRYEVTVEPLYGCIHYRDSSEKLEQWSEMDVRSNRLAYTHTAPDRVDYGATDLIGVDLFDQDREEAYIIQIHISEIELRVSDSDITVSEGGEGVIDEMYLSAEAVGDESVTDTDLKFRLAAPPRNGKILLNGNPVTNFTQAELSGPGLVYRHDHSNTISDSFDYTVSIAQHRAVKSGTFTITVRPVDDDPPTLVFLHQPLFVVEGSEIGIVREHIQVFDFDTNMELPTQINRIEFQIIAQPSHGDVLRSQGVSSSGFKKTKVFTLYEVNHHSVKYISHPVDERSEIVNWSDWFLVNLTDGENTHETPYNFTFVILPNIVSIRARSFQVAEGEDVILPADTIEVLHPYLSTQLGLIVINEQPSNGTFVNVTSGEENISNFTTADLKAGRIMYRHNDAEKAKDRVKLTYEAHQHVYPDNQTQPGSFPEGFMRTSNVVTLDINIITKNDRGPEIRSGSETTLVMWAEDCAFLSVQHLDVVDLDTPNSKLIYTFNFTSIDAYISHINESRSTKIHTFTQEDVVNSLIKLFHQSGETGVMHYTVTDGDFSVSGKLLIETHRLEIVVLRNNPLSVPMNGMVAITSNELEVGTSDVNTSISRCFFNEVIEYQFEANYGIIVVNGTTNATSFTDDDVKRGRVYYQHTKPEIWESLETLKLKGKAMLTHVKEFELQITIDLPSEPNSPLAVHKSLAVIERGRACLNESILDARNIRYNATYDAFNHTLTSWFVFYYSEDSHGEVLLEGRRPPGMPPRVSQDQIANGSVCYQNNGDESTRDPLKFSVLIEDSGNGLWGFRLNLVLNVSVTLINDEAPIVVSSSLMMPVVEGFSVPVTNDSLSLVDEDNPASDLVFTVVDLPPGGYLLLDGDRMLQKQSTFTQVMVNEGRLRFGAQDIGEWTALLSFTDGSFTNVTNFTVLIEEHFVKVVGTNVLRYSQNENGAHLTLKHIVTETNGQSIETVYFLVETPVNGDLKGLREGQFFTQSDLLDEKVAYVPTNFRAHSDSFKINVRNREAENSTVAIDVRVEVWGQVKQNIELNFDSMAEGDLSLPLPKNILQLTDLQFLMQRPPIIHVMQQPKLGFLEVKVSTTSRKRRATSPTPTDKFFYDFLDYDWVYYTWNASNVTLENPGEEGVYDSFSILVEGYEGIQPGEADITLYIKNPPVPVDYLLPPTDAKPSPSDSPTVYTAFVEDGNSGFPIYALVPIVGVFVILLLIISVVIVFCVTQQGRIRKRLQPKLMPRHRPLTRPQMNSFHMQPSSNIYGVESSTATHREAMTSFNEMTDYRESHSPISRHSPLARYSPLASHPPSSAVFPSERYHHHQHMIPRPRSRRSNVSVSYSHRPLSEVTLEELPRSCQPSPMAAPNPLRPTTRCSSVYEAGEAGEEESGYLSTPNPSIAAGDEPVRLVLRRPAVEEVSPLPRDVSGDPEDVEEREDESCEQQLQDETVGGAVDHIQERGASTTDLATDHQDNSISQSTTTPVPPDQGETPAQGEELQYPDGEENVAHHSNGAHAVGTPPSDPNLPLLPESRPVSSAASATGGSNSHAPSPSDLQTLFRTHNPILKRTEYWV